MQMQVYLKKKNNVKMDIKEINCEDVACIILLLLTVKLLALTNTVTMFHTCRMFVKLLITSKIIRT
jgi:hypothetical protein